MSSVLMGDETLLVQCAEMLRERHHPIVAVVTGADNVAKWASGVGIPVIAPGQSLAQELAVFEFDWFFSIANLRMVPGDVWRRARLGAINFHDGPLPRYAGLNAPAWAILGGESQHGVTWHALADRVDEGDIYAQSLFDISEHDTALTLNTKCFEAGIASFAELIEKMEAGTLAAQAQEFSQRNYFAKNARPTGAATLDFTKPVAEISRVIRALSFGRGYANPLGMAKIRTDRGMLFVTDASVEAGDASAMPGTVLTADETGATIAAADGVVRVTGLSCVAGQSIAVSTALQAGEVLRSPDAGTIEKLTELATALARDEDYFQKQLRDARNPVLDGLTPASAAIQPQWETAMLTLPDDLVGDRAVTALAIVFARLGHQARFQLGYADDRLSALARDFAGYVAPTAPLTFAIDPKTTVADIATATKATLGALRLRTGVSADLIARSPRLNAVRPAVVIRQTETVGPADPLPDSALMFVISGASPSVQVAFDRSRLPHSALTALLRQADAVLAALTTEDAYSKMLSQLPVVSAAEIHDLVVLRNQTARDYDRTATVHQLIEAQARRTPDAPALHCGGDTLTYAELDARATRVAETLAGLGVGPDSLVGLNVSRSCDLVVGALGIWKAGGAYVPLDPTYPSDRVALMIEDSGLKIVFTDAGAAPLADAGIRTLTVDEAASSASTGVALPKAGAENLAYVIYTSGSTGRPKGVMIEHRNVVNFFVGMDERIPRSGTEQPVWLAVTSLSFDISVLELFWTLARGFAVVVHADQRKAVAAAAPKQRVAGDKSAMDFSLYFWGNDDGAGPRKYQLLLDGARYADGRGFCAVWTPERHFHAFGGPYPNPSVTGAAVAAVTRNLDIRGGSCVLPLHHPARVAEEWAVIDNISNGRAGVAFASGWMPDDFLLRPENAPPNNKTAMLRDIDVVRKLWRGDAVMFQAPGGKQVNVVTQPRPVSKELPVWLTTAGNPDSYREAARMGCNVLTHLLGQSIEEVAGKIRIYRQTLAECGRNPDNYTVTLMLHTLIGEDREQVRELAREPMKAYLRSATALIKEYAWAFPAFKKPAGANKAMDIDLRTLDADELDAIIEFAFLRYFDDSGLFGTVDDALARVRQLKAIGVDEIACLVDFGVPTEVALQALEPLADVVAAARSLAPEAEHGGLAALIANHGVTHLQCTPSMAAMMLMNDDDLRALGAVKHLFIGGEALQPALVKELNAATSATIENMYGPTETTIWSSTGPAVLGDGAVPLGTPIANTQLYVLDDAQQLVPAGVAGELYIAGDGVTRGYLGREDLTRERFLADPFVPGGRMYRTGDLVRYAEDGALNFLGRADFQVKVRGYRIELGEIEARIGLHPAVAEAVVVARAEDSNDVRIVAYVRYKAGPVPDAELKTHVRGALPDFMVPSHFVTMQSFPLTPNAKVDRKALPRPEEAAKAQEQVAEFVAPANDLQKQLSDAFKRILGVERVGAFDNFFYLGGHSLLAVQLHRDLKKSLAPNLTITDVYRFPTVAGLAGHLQDRDQAGKQLSQVAERAAARRQAQLARRPAPARPR